MSVTIFSIGRPEERTLGKIVEIQALNNKEKPCFYFEDQIISYQDLNKLANRAANWFLNMGIKKGDKVCILFQNCPEFFYICFGLAKIGAVIVPLNIAHKGSILQYMINNSDAKAMIVDKQFLDNIKFIEGNLGNLTTLIVFPNDENIPQFRFDTYSYQEILGSSTTNVQIDAKFSDPVSIMYTSGTTGPSKGVVWSHNQAIWMAEQFMTELRATSNDIFHSWLPLFHMAGFLSIVGFLVVGGTVAIVKRFSASRFWDETRKFNATISSGFITTLEILYKQPSKEDDARNPVRAIITGGVPKLIADDFEKRFNVVLVNDYGLTEFDPISYSDYDDRDRRSCGKGIRDVEVKIFDEYDNDLPPNEIGEIVARPLKPYIMMMEYYKSPDQTIQAWRNLWFHTGDYGYKDEDGHIYFVDRKKDRIRRKGENVSSFELETIILSHPAVAECVIVGVPSELGEDDIKVVIKLEKGSKLSPKGLLEFCEERLALFMVPRYVEFVEDFPRSTAEKVKKGELKAITEKTWDRDKTGYKIKRR